MKTLVFVALLASGVTPIDAQTPSGSPVEIPLSVEDGRLIVPVQASDGTELAFVVSTANASTILSQSGAARLSAGATLTMGGVSIQTDNANTVPDAGLTINGTVYDGMVASNTLSRFDVLIDAPGGRLVLKPLGRLVTWEGMTLSDPVRLRVYHGVILALDVELDGRPYMAALELGTAALVVNEPVRAQLQLDAEDTAALTLGGVVFDGMPVRVRDLDIIQRFDPNGDGFVLVGAPFAIDCAVSISWVHQELRTCVR